jgi:DnaJ family protein C protein 28
MALRLYRLTSYSLCTLNYAPRMFLRENKTASAKLFEDASSPAELAEERRLAARREHLEQVMGVGKQQGENWTGDESLQDTVLRMLVDKYKPMRGIAGGIKTADEKLKANPPLVNGRLIEEIVDEDEEGSRMIRTNAIPREPPILPGIEGHEPWMTTFKTPSFAKSPQIKVMRLPPLGPPSETSSTTKTEGKSKAKADRGKMKRVKEATRMGNAKERMLDYRYGGSIRASAPNPTTMRGWQSLIDDRIEVSHLLFGCKPALTVEQKARAQGEFNALKGHGKPLTAEIEAKNPFISREEVGTYLHT